MISQERFNQLEMEYGCGYWNVCWEHACPCAIITEHKGLTKEIYNSLVEEGRRVVEMDEKNNDYFDSYSVENNYDCDQYDDDWYEEEDLLTNFAAYELPLYKQAIKEYKDDTLFISDEAYNCYGHKMEGSYSLRTKIHQDRSIFWNLLESLRPSFKNENKITE